ncbi:MAG: 6-phosphogluconate dehydrogenase, decarboxylating, partial [uncultured Rubrobacteraceae bacterium]
GHRYLWHGADGVQHGPPAGGQGGPPRDRGQPLVRQSRRGGRGGGRGRLQHRGVRLQPGVAAGSVEHAAGGGYDGRHDRAVHAARQRGRHHRGRGELVLPGLRCQGQGGAQRRLPVAGRRGLGRRLGLRRRVLHHDRGRRRCLRARRAGIRDARAGQRLRLPRRRGGRPLRQDGPQRGRVRDAPGLRRGVRDPPEVPLRLRPARPLEPLEPGQRGPVVASGARRERLRAGREPRQRQGLRRGLGRGALDGARGHRRERPGQRHRRLALRPLRLPPGRLVRHEGNRGAARTVRRARHPGGEHGVPGAGAKV